MAERVALESMWNELWLLSSMEFVKWNFPIPPRINVSNDGKVEVTFFACLELFSQFGNVESDEFALVSWLVESMLFKLFDLSVDVCDILLVSAWSNGFVCVECRLK